MTAYFLDNASNNLKMYIRFALGLRAFLKEKITFEEAQREIKKRMEQREENFLKIIRKGIFEYKKSPYLALLKLSKYEYKDIEGLVSRYGLEETLRVLKADGVYLKIEEFKGRSPVVRKGKEFIFKERDFDNPYLAPCYEIRSGGTRSAGTRIMTDFDFLSQLAVHRGFLEKIWNTYNIPHIILRPAFRYGSGIWNMLLFSKIGIYPIKWLSLIDERKMPISLRSKLGVYYIIYASKLFGAKFPKPEFMDLKDISKVVELIHDLLEKHSQCAITTNVSSAVRICLAAKEQGVNLNGLIFQGSGEPLTSVKNKEIESSGAKFILSYVFSEVGSAGSLCLRSSTVDDIHLFKYALALISYERKVIDEYVDAFLFTTLLPSAPKILLNVESGDYGIIETKNCGCPYDSLGFYEHIHHIRSFEKLTGEGITFYGTDLIRILEEILPSEFGGTSLDYQLIEEDDEKGITHLIVLVSPKVGAIDENRLIQTILNELKKGGTTK